MITITRGKDFPAFLQLIKGDNTYESGASVSYTIYNEDGTNTEVDTQSTVYDSTPLKGYYDLLDVSVSWSDQEEGNYLLVWAIENADGFPDTMTYNLCVVPGEVESGYTHTEVLRAMMAALSGEASGGGTSLIKFKDPSGTTDRITANVDRRGNRSSITLDV